MIPAKYGQITFIFFVSICMSCVVSGVSVLNTAGFVNAFFGLWMTAWLKSWIIAFPSLLIIAPSVRRFVDKLLIKE
jgi:hypothetical protein